MTLKTATLMLRSGRFSLLINFILWFLCVSSLLRIALFIWQYDQVSWNIFNILRTLFTGLFFDIGTAIFITLLATLYYILFPNKWIGSLADRILVWFFTAVTTFIVVFTFFAEITFWEEFRTRFNFIAVDYLIYTHEVVANIKESYPLPLLVTGVLLVTGLVLTLFVRVNVFKNTFSNSASAPQRFAVLGLTTAIALFYSFFISNTQAEWSDNRYNSEISSQEFTRFFQRLGTTR